MLQLKKYEKNELTEILGTRSKQGIQRKLRNYGITFEEEGRGENVIFDLSHIENPFKVFCITEMDFPAQTDFNKLRNFFYYFLCDENFPTLPDEVKEFCMRENGKVISRQTLANWQRRLDRIGYISKNSGNFAYYFAYKGTRRMVEKKEYSKAWHGYWEMKDNGFESGEAIARMIGEYGGVARKYEIPEFNGIYMNEIRVLTDLVCDSMEQFATENLS